MPKPKSRDLKVVLDTNALYTGSASYFIRKEIADLIAEHKGLPDLRIHWMIPQTVRDERHFQMLTEARRFLDPVAKLERLLGHKLNITTDILDTRVNEAIARQISDHGLELLQLDASQVDWKRLASDAAFRRPPFSSGEKEKGFRDALVLEAFAQLIATSPASPSTCRLAIVSADELLQTAVSERVSNATNVHVLDSIDSLKGLINTLASTADEAFIGQILIRAGRLFFLTGDKDTLYYKWGLGQALRAALDNAPVTLPQGADKFSIGKWTINPPRFVRKQGQKITLLTRFNAGIVAQKSPSMGTWGLLRQNLLSSSIQAETPPLSKATLNLSSLYKFPEGMDLAKSSFDPSIFAPSMNSFQLDQTVASGTGNVDVTWSVSVTTTGHLKSPALDSVTYVDAIWDSDAS